MTMHIECAAEAVARAEAQFEGEKADRYAIESYADDETILKVVDTLDNEKAKSIAATIRKSRKSRYAKVTSKQRWAIATALLEAYGSARAVYAAAYGVTEKEFMANAE